MTQPATIQDPDNLRRTRDVLVQIASESTAGGNDRNPMRHVELLQELLTPAVCNRLAIYQLPSNFLLSVVIPVYNELATVEQAVHRVQQSEVPHEIILVDDGSTDGTRELVQSWRGRPGMKILMHQSNQGKGVALKTGFSEACGDIVIIQDADLEYHPADYMWLLQPMVEGHADVVYGSRFSGIDRAVYPYWHQTANWVITLMSNLFTNRKLSDVETGYKLFRREVIQEITPALREKGFGIELEITAKVARMPGVRMYERPIRYTARSYAAGKKIQWRDAVWAVWCVLRYGLFRG